MLSSLEDSLHIVSHFFVFVNMFFCFSFEIFSAGLSAQPLSSDSFAIITNHTPFVNTFFVLFCRNFIRPQSRAKKRNPERVKIHFHLDMKRRKRDLNPRAA